MAEYLDDLLTAEHFFNVTVDSTEVILLGNKVFSALAANFFGKDEHDQHHQNGNQCQVDTQSQHDDEYGNDRDQCCKGLRDALVDHLTQGIGIVGVQTHNFTMRVGVKKADWKSLHVNKHLVADTFEYTLTDINHQSVIDIGAENTNIVNNCKNCNSISK